jgi:hypothetical protein
MNAADIAAAPVLPAVTPRADHCAVSGCQCVPTVRHAVLCEPNAKKFRLRRPPMSMEQFLADPRVRPLRRCRRARWRRAPGRPMARAATATPHCQRWRTAHHSNLQQHTELPVVDAVRPTWSPEAPDSRPAAMSTWGMPPRPNPPTAKLTPSVMSARASRALAPPCSSCPVRSLVNRSWQPHRLAAVSWTLRAPNTAAVPLRDGGPPSRRARGRPGAPWPP